MLCQAQPVLESLNRLLEDAGSRDDLLQAAVPVEEDREMGSRGPQQEPTKEGLPPALQDAQSHREGHSSKKGRRACHRKARWGTSPRRTPSPFSSYAFPHQEDPDGAQGNCSSSARLGEEQGTRFLGGQGGERPSQVRKAFTLWVGDTHSGQRQATLPSFAH